MKVACIFGFVEGSAEQVWSPEPAPAMGLSTSRQMLFSRMPLILSKAACYSLFVRGETVFQDGRRITWKFLGVRSQTMRALSPTA